jgi:hypothetical protein
LPEIFGRIVSSRSAMVRFRISIEESIMSFTLLKKGTTTNYGAYLVLIAQRRWRAATSPGGSNEKQFRRYAIMM